MNISTDQANSSLLSWARVVYWVLMLLSAIGFLLGLVLHLAALLGVTDSPHHWFPVHAGLPVVWLLMVGIGIYRGWKRGGDDAPLYPKWMQVFILCLFVYSASYLVSVMYLVYSAMREGRPDAPAIAETLGVLGMTSFPLVFHAAAFMFFYTILFREERKEQDHWPAS